MIGRELLTPVETKTPQLNSSGTSTIHLFAVTILIMNGTITPEAIQRARSKTLRRERLRILNACQQCRSRKTKCDGAHPGWYCSSICLWYWCLILSGAVCTKCQAKALPCSYGYDSTGTAINVDQKPRQDSSSSNTKPLNAYETTGTHSHVPVSSAPTLQQPTPTSPPASVELVQCLMVINRYLHCTNNQHKTWMTAGMAMRVAQSIGCHVPETVSVKGLDSDRQLKKRVWVSCVALDR